MKSKYFNDTDTALLELSDNPVVETIEVSERVYIDLDSSGNPVSITIEHAKTTAHLPDLIFQHIDKASA